MSSVDNRIVKMTFDNAQFERGTKQTIDTLNKLKKSLDFNTSVTGLDALQNQINGISVKRLSDSLTTLPGILKLKVFDKITDMGLSAIKNIFTSVPSQIKNGGWARALNIENARFQIEGLKGDWNALEDDINYAVKGTAYGFDAAASAASQLTASGIQAGDAMKTALRGISGVAAMTNTTYENISPIFTTIAGNGRMMGEQLNQISARGLNAAAALSKYLNSNQDLKNQLIDTAIATGKNVTAIKEFANATELTEANIRTLVSAGAIDFDTFAKAMDSAFGEHATKANETLNGSISNMKAALSKIGQIFAQPVIQSAPKAFAPIITGLNNFKDNLKATVEGPYKDLVVTFFQALGNILERLRPAFEKLGTIIGNVLNPAINFLNKLLKPLANMGAAVSKTVGEVTTKVEAVSNAVELTTDKIDELAHAVIRGEFGNGQERIEGLGDSFAAVQNRVNELLGCEKRWPVYTNGATDAIDAQTAALNDSTAATGVNIKVQKQHLSMFDTLVLTIANLKVGFNNIVTSLKQVGGAIKDAFTSVFAGAGDRAKNAVVGLASGFASLTSKLVLSKDKIKSLTNVLKVFATGINIAFGVVKIAVNVIKDLIVFVVKCTKNFIEFINPVKRIKSLFDSFNDSIMSFNRGTGSRFLDLFGATKKTVGEYKGTINGAREGTIEYAKTLDSTNEKLTTSQKVINAIQNTVNKVKDKIINSIEKVKDSLKKLANDKRVKELIKQWKEAFKALKDALGLGLGKIIDFITNIGKSTKEANSSGNLFVDFIGNLAGNLVKLNNALASGSLSSIGDTIKRFSSGIASIPLNSIKTVSDTISQTFGTDIPEALERFKETSSKSAVGSTIGSFFDGLADFGKRSMKDATAGSVATFMKNLAVIVFTIKQGKNLDASRQAFVSMTEGFKSIAYSIQSLVITAQTAEKDFVKIEKTRAFSHLIKTISITLGIMVASIVALSFIPTDKIHSSLKALGDAVMMLIGIVATLTVASIAMDKYTKGEGKSLLKFSGMMIGISVSLYLLAGAMKIFSMMKASTIRKGLTCITELLAIFVIASRFVKDVRHGTVSFVGMAFAINIIIPAIMALSAMDDKKFLKGAKYIGAIMLEMALATRIASGTVGSAGTMFGMAALIYVLVPALGILGIMPWNVLLKGAGAIVAIMFALAGASRIASKSSADAKSLTSMAAIVVATAAALWILSTMDFKKLLEVASVFSAVILAVGTACYMGTKNLKGVNATGIASLAVFLGGAVAALEILSSMPSDDLLKRALGLSAVLVAIGGGMYLYSKAMVSVNAKSLRSGILSLVILLGISIGALEILMQLPGETGGLITKATALGIVLNTAASAFFIYSKGMRGFNTKNTLKNILSLGALLAASTGALYVLSEKMHGDPIALNGRAVALGIVMNTLASAFLIYSKGMMGFNVKGVKDSILSLATLVSAGIIAIVSLDLLKSDPTTLNGRAVALGIVLNTLASAFVIFSAGNALAAVNNAGLLPGLVNLAALTVAGIAAIVVLDNLNSDPATLTGRAVALGIALNMLASAFVIFSAGNALAAITSAGLLPGLINLAAVTVAGIAAVVVLDNLKSDPAGLLTKAKALGVALLSLSASMLILSGVGLLGPAALIGVASLDAVLGDILAIGAIFEKFKGLNKALDTGIDVINKMASGLGRALGNFISSFATSVLSGLPVIGAELSLFATTSKPFFDRMKEIKGDTVESIKLFAEAMTELGKASIIKGIGDWFTGSDSLDTFKDQLPKIAQGLIDFQTELDKGPVNPAVCNLALKVLTAIAKFANDIPNTGGLLGKIVGNNDMGTWASQLETLGEGVMNFNDAVIDGVNYEACNNAIKVLKALANMANDIPNTGGLLGKIVGNNDISTWANQLETLGEGVMNFNKNVGSGVNVDACGAAIDVLSRLANMANDIPNSGGLLGKIVGNNDMGTWASDMESIGQGLSSFSDEVAKINLAACETGISVIGKFVDLYKTLPKGDGVLGSIVKSLFGGDIKDPSSMMKKMGESIKNFNDEIQDISMDSITTGIDSITKIVNVSKIVNGASTGNIAANLIAFKSMATTTADFSSRMGGIDPDTLGNAIQDVNRLVAMATRLDGVNMNGMATFSTAFKSLGSDTITAFVNAFSNGQSRAITAINQFINGITSSLSSKQSQFRTVALASINGYISAISTKAYNAKLAAQTLVNAAVQALNAGQARFASAGTTSGNNYATGIRSSINAASSAGTALANAASAGIRSQNNYNNFHEAGVYVAQGFADGITANTQAAVNAAYAMGKAAAAATKRATDEHSPSRVFFGIGDFVTQGFVNGIYAKMDQVDLAGTDLGLAAYEAIKTPLEMVRDAMASDEFANPVITPVLDMSNVNNAARDISGLMASRSIALASLDSVGFQRNSSSQNGSDTTSNGAPIGQNITFTQNNYSPKALSTGEIYRNTNSQLALMKGVVGNA